MTLYLNESEIKSRAPKAANWNRILSTQDELDSDTKGHFVVLNRTTNQSLSWPVSGVDDTVSFTNELLDTDSAYTASTLTLPSYAVAYRITWNVYLNSLANLEVQNISYGFEVGAGSTGAGVQHFNVMTDWIGADGGDTVTTGLALDAVAGSSATVVANEYTWVCVEFV